MAWNQGSTRCREPDARKPALRSSGCHLWPAPNGARPAAARPGLASAGLCLVELAAARHATDERHISASRSRSTRTSAPLWAAAARYRRDEKQTPLESCGAIHAITRAAPSRAASFTACGSGLIARARHSRVSNGARSSLGRSRLQRHTCAGRGRSRKTIARTDWSSLWVCGRPRRPHT